MSNEKSARDPYVGLNQHFSRRASDAQRPGYTIGKLLSLRPLKVRADGIDLDKDDLRVPESMYSNFVGDEPFANHGVWTFLPEKEFTCYCGLSKGIAVRPEEYVYGSTVLSVGDEVLLLRSEDGQTYYLIERMVTL